MRSKFILVFLLLGIGTLSCIALYRAGSVSRVGLALSKSMQNAFWSFVPSPIRLPEKAGTQGHPTMADFWDGTAGFVLTVQESGLPMGESDTLRRRGESVWRFLAEDELWSYVHASHRSANIIDQCGAPVAFPGCVVIYRSRDGGNSFALDSPVCQFKCNQCPCNSQFDHIDQQQYPRVEHDGHNLHMVYEYRGMVMYRRSEDGLEWSHPVFVPRTGFWATDYQPCRPEQQVGQHPFVAPPAECLSGGPPGIHVQDRWLYIFVGMGQNPGSIGCYKSPISEEVAETMFEQMIACEHNPLITGVSEYGPLEDRGPAVNPFFSFRTLSSVEIQQIDERYYMLFEGVRGPGQNDPGDTQFGLGLARSMTNQLDGPWETYADNPILVDMPGNIGVGHADLVVLQGQTILYTSIDGTTRSRLELVWK